MWRPAGCPLCPRVPLPLPHVVPLVALLPQERAAVGFLFAAGAEVAADVLLSALSPNLAQMLVVEEGLFRGAGVLPFWLRDRVPGS